MIFHSNLCIFILVIHVLLEVDAFEGLNDRMVW